jgi:hypothetical protein
MALRAAPVAAADGDPIIIGTDNSATTPTGLRASISMSNVISVLNDDTTGPNSAIHCSSVTGSGLAAFTMTGTAVYADSMGPGRAVRAGSFGRGGVAIVAEGSGGATGLRGTSDTGYGLNVSGKVRFATRSGRATVAAGKAFVDIDLRQKGGLSGTPLCFANLTSHRPGVHIAAVRPNDPVAGKARIYLNGAVSSNAHVAWLVLN